MGLLRFSKKARRSLDPFQRSKITILCSLGCAVSFTLLVLIQDFSQDASHTFRRLQATEHDDTTTTVPPDLYPPNGLLEKPYIDEPTGKKFLALFFCLGIAYMVLGLNTVCDVYFAGSIDLLCDAWDLTPDVAGATWMAAGGSAPEFFTSMIGATIAQNDVGFGTIVGSAVFNVLFVIGLCGYVAKGNIELTWWPLFRDCTYYITSLAVLACFTFNQLIEAWEAVILFVMYIGYVSFMFVNKPMNVWAYQKTGTPLNKELREYVEEMNKSKSKVEPEKVGAAEEGDAPKTDNFMQDKVMEPTPDAEASQSAGKDSRAAKEQEKEEAEDDDDDDDDEPEDFMIIPEGTVNRILWGLSLPVYLPIWLTLPWPSKGSKYYMATFFLSLVWIAAFSFCLVWWTDIVASVIGIPTIVSSVTFLAAATSIPDAVSSMAVARKGQADMAVSSSVGSNIFDILVGLPIPWLIKCAIESSDPDFRGIRIRSPYLMFYTCLLLAMVFGTVISIKISGWKLQKSLGCCMAVLYVVFVLAVVAVEGWQPEWLMSNPPS
mmetsp:Transcript_90654/g.216451  ORF Transcript_90654/g.216451 Transcript_90654/m.216451 type:complete len:546 (+) Transcript_90654:123-1760(+)